MTLIDWSRVDGPRVVENFLSRRVMPCQRRVHSAYEYQGGQDSTRMHRDNLEKAGDPAKDQRAVQLGRQ